MSWLRLIAIVVSVIIHGSIGYAMLPAFRETNSEALDMGSGTDIVLVEQGIAEEGISKLGDAMETIETAEIVPVQAAPPPPPSARAPSRSTWRWPLRSRRKQGPSCVSFSRSSE